MRFVHAVPGLSSVDLFAGDGKAFDNVAYKATSAYRELPAASAAYRLRLAGQDTAERLLADRFARGEIDEEEYRRALATLRSASTGPGGW